MTRRLLIALLAALAALVTLAGPASAGGWAVTTLDALPAGGIAPGQATPVGYTIRQHGVTPVHLEDSALLVTMADGRVLRFPGVADSTPGHHVAQVVVPTAGHFALTADQGWFADQELGHLDVGTASPAAPAAVATPSDDGWPTGLLVALVVATAGGLLLLGFQLGAATRARRRRPAPLAGAGT